jgi:hypothetical protein
MQTEMLEKTMEVRDQLGSASLSESEWDWERRSAFFWLVMAVVADEVNE